MPRIVILTIIYLSCLGMHAEKPVFADYVYPGVGTALSETLSASVFGKKTEVLSQTLPACDSIIVIKN